jgi:hypothetical protein
MNKPTPKDKVERPLHEIILETIIQNWPDRPVPLSAEDVLWKMNDPKLELRHIKQVLDWLVHQGEMGFSYGKYTLKSHLFFELRNEKIRTESKNAQQQLQPKAQQQQPTATNIFLKSVTNAPAQPPSISIEGRRVKRKWPLLLFVFLFAAIFSVKNFYTYKNLEKWDYEYSRQVMPSLEMPSHPKMPSLPTERAVGENMETIKQLHKAINTISTATATTKVQLQKQTDALMGLAGTLAVAEARAKTNAWEQWKLNAIADLAILLLLTVVLVTIYKLL